MKKIFKMLLLTLVCGAVLLGLRWAWQFLRANSTLGTTVDTLMYRCIAVLGLAAVLLYLRCWASLIADGVRARRVARVRKEAASAFSIRLGMRDAPADPTKKAGQKTKKPQLTRAKTAAVQEKAKTASEDEKAAAPEAQPATSVSAQAKPATDADEPQTALSASAEPQPAASFEEPETEDKPSREPALAGTVPSDDGWVRSSDKGTF